MIVTLFKRSTMKRRENIVIKRQ